MPSVKKQHQRKVRRSKNSQKKRKMRGGALFNADSVAAKYASCTSADRHNLISGNDNLDLIQGKGALPNQTGGNGACPNSGESLTFKDYVNSVAKNLYDNPVPTMTGGGYAIDPAAEQIGGQPARVGYSDCCPPVSVDGMLLMGANSGAVCGQQAGGGSKKSHGKKHGKKKGSKKRGSMKSRKSQKGGDSMPALFPGESHNGEDGDFNDTGAHLDYAARQPFWGPAAR